MATLTQIVTAIQGVLQDPNYTEPYLVSSINNAVSSIAAGIRMPDGIISPPLPDLYANDVVHTSTAAFVSLPVNYQRKVFMVYDDTSYQLLPPIGGDYYAFTKFLRQVNRMDLTEPGSIYRVCVKGNNLYYQGIPTTSTLLGVHYYRKPATLALDEDVPEGIPEHLHTSIIKHYVCKEIFGEKIEDGQDNKGIGTKYHTTKFFEDMNDLIDFVGQDDEPQYYGGSGFEDRGICDG